jgi:Oxidoreductase family, NAD-binding Rossmann fold
MWSAVHREHLPGDGGGGQAVRGGPFRRGGEPGGDRARRFADDLDLELAFASYQALLECDGVDAVYVALPIPMHIEWAIKALRAGKHVLCEKAFAVSPEDARRAFDAAADARRMCTEAGSCPPGARQVQRDRRARGAGLTAGPHAYGQHARAAGPTGRHRARRGRRNGWPRT